MTHAQRVHRTVVASCAVTVMRLHLSCLSPVACGGGGVPLWHIRNVRQCTGNARHSTYNHGTWERAPGNFADVLAGRAFPCAVWRGVWRAIGALWRAGVWRFGALPPSAVRVCACAYPIRVHTLRAHGTRYVCTSHARTRYALRAHTARATCACDACARDAKCIRGNALRNISVLRISVVRGCPPAARAMIVVPPSHGQITRGRCQRLTRGLC